MARLRAAALSAFAVALLACSSGGSSAGEPTSTTVASIPSTTSTTLDLGGLPLHPPARYQPIPVPRLGFGLAVPDGWQVALLTDSAFSQLEGSGAVAPAFIDAARQAKAAGAVLYAAGIDPGDRVSDLKVFRLAARPLGEVAEEARSSAPPDAQLSLEGGRARIRFQTSGGGVTAEGTQWLVSGPDAVWSLIITSEDPKTHDQLAATIVDSLVFSP